MTPENDVGDGARRAGVLGSPISHSLSPVLHRTAYQALGLAGWSYDAVEAVEADLPRWLQQLDGSWAGLSLTMPLKQAVIPLLDLVDPLAVAVGAVNTVLVQPAGGATMLVGANTDVAGIVAAMREAGTPGAGVDGRPAGTAPREPRRSGSQRRALVLGGGATAASALAALAELGAPAAAVCVRSKGRAVGVVRAAHRMGVNATLHSWEDAASLLPRADLVVQTAPSGAADALASALDALSPGSLRMEQVLLDVVYDPWPTPLAAAWLRAGGSIAPGWLMLLHQAGEQVRLMTGRDAPLEAMRAALSEALAAR